MPDPLEQLPLDDLWSLWPHTYAAKASMGEWVPGPPHEFLSEQLAPKLAAGNCRAVIHLPPGHGKSTLLNHWVPIWKWENFPRSRIILATHTRTYSKYWGEKVLTTVRQRNPLITPRPFRTTASTHQFKTQEGGEWLAEGVEGAIIGYRATDFFIDDPISGPDDAFSPAHQQMLRNFVDGVVETRLEPNGNVILLMHRWHENDLAAYLIEKGYTYYCLPAIAEENDIMGRKQGQALWPGRFPIEALLRKKNGDAKLGLKGIPDYFWQAMYQGSPVPIKGRIIDVDLFRYWTALPMRFEQWAIFADLNMKEEKGVKFEGQKNDFTVFQCWGRIGSNCYLVDQVRGVWGITEQVDQFLKFVRKWPRAGLKGIENKANGPALQNLVQAKVPGVILLEPEGGKVLRAMACEPLLKAGNVLIPHDQKLHPWVRDFIHECRTFPAAKHDDQVDTMGLALVNFNRNMNDSLSILSKW